MKASALMPLVASAMLVSAATPLVAHAEWLLNDEVETGTAIRIKHGDRTRFAGLVPVGNDRKMYLECVGTGSPTVVLISGFRGARDDWTHVIDPANPVGDPMSARSAVFPKVGKFTRVCAYDRPGTTDFGGRLTDCDGDRCAAVRGPDSCSALTVATSPLCHRQHGSSDLQLN